MSFPKKPVIYFDTYFEDMLSLDDKIDEKEFDCIVCLKRSGFILGAFLSNKKTLHYLLLLR